MIVMIVMTCIKLGSLLIVTANENCGLRCVIFFSASEMKKSERKSFRRDIQIYLFFKLVQASFPIT